MDREVWFRRFMWGYRPCHPKGWALSAGFLVLAWGLQSLTEWLMPTMLGLGGTAILGLGIGFWIVAERHAEPRRRE